MLPTFRTDVALELLSLVLEMDGSNVAVELCLVVVHFRTVGTLKRRIVVQHPMLVQPVLGHELRLADLALVQGVGGRVGRGLVFPEAGARAKGFATLGAQYFGRLLLFFGHRHKHLVVPDEVVPQTGNILKGERAVGLGAVEILFVRLAVSDKGRLVHESFGTNVADKIVAGRQFVLFVVLLQVGGHALVRGQHFVAKLALFRPLELQVGQFDKLVHLVRVVLADVRGHDLVGGKVPAVGANLFAVGSFLVHIHLGLRSKNLI